MLQLPRSNGYGCPQYCRCFQGCPKARLTAAQTAARRHGPRHEAGLQRQVAGLQLCLSVCYKASSRLMVTAWKVGCRSRGRSFSVCGHSKIRVEITTAPLKLLFLQSWGGELHMLLLKITWKLLFFLRIIFFPMFFIGRSEMCECFKFFSACFLPQHFWNVKYGLFDLAGELP